MTRIERIKSMDCGEIAGLMWKYGIDQIIGFLNNGGAGCMNFMDLREWLEGEYDEQNDKWLNGQMIGEDDE